MIFKICSKCNYPIFIYCSFIGIKENNIKKFYHKKCYYLL